MSEVRGYKVFNPDWTYKGFQYQIEECYEMDEKPMVHIRGFHFCKNLIDCYDSYDFNKENKVAEIAAYGEIDTDERTYCTNKIKIERELKWEEVLSIVNTGKSCIGLGSTGYKNIGYYNPRDWNIKDLITKDEMIQIRQKRWNQLDKREKEVIMSIPNFNKNIFKEITGIDVEGQ